MYIYFIQHCLNKYIENNSELLILSSFQLFPPTSFLFLFTPSVLSAHCPRKKENLLFFPFFYFLYVFVSDKAKKKKIRKLDLVKTFD